MRGLLREFGIVIPIGSRRVRPTVTALLADTDCTIPVALHPALQSAIDEVAELERRLRQVESQIAAPAAVTPAVENLRTIPGVGLLTSTALVAFVTEAKRFPTARHFASYLGLTPRERSSGLRRHLGAISKRGDPYLRMLLIHGARSVLCHAKHATSTGRLQRWALALEHSRGHNKAAVALANKIARIAWAVWTTGSAFETKPALASTLKLVPA